MKRFLFALGCLAATSTACATSRLDDPSNRDAPSPLPTAPQLALEELHGDFEAHAWPQAIAATQPGFRVTHSDIVHGFAAPNRGIASGRTGPTVELPRVKPYLFGNDGLRDVMDVSSEIIVSFRGVGRGDALAVLFGLPPIAVRQLLDAQLQERLATMAFHEENGEALPPAPADLDAIAARRPLRLVNALKQLVVIREDGTWVVMSPEARKRGEALLKKPLVASPPSGSLAAMRIGKWMFLDKYPMLGELRLGIEEVTASLDGPRLWTVAAKVDGDVALARITCDAVLASVRAKADSAEGVDKTRRCSMQGDRIVGRVELPAAFSMGLKVHRSADGQVEITPDIGATAVRDAEP